MVETIDMLGVPVSAISPRTAFEEVAKLIVSKIGGYVCVADVHSVMKATQLQSHLASMRGAAMVTPDGTPLVVLGRLLGNRNIQRVCGPDFVGYLIGAGVELGWKHFFFGGAEGVPDAVADKMAAAYPGAKIAGAYSPPFRPLTVAEDLALERMIADAEADIIWVGLGCPKQEAWMAANWRRFPGKVLIGVGAAFDFHAGRVKRAPLWMRSIGFEWLHRLFSEPRRLWRRYLVDAPRFVVYAALQLSGRVRATSADGL